MANIYFSIAKITSLKDCYAVKKIEVDYTISLSSSSDAFRFDIEDAILIYVGHYINAGYMPEKLEFDLIRYKTKINNDIYKIDLQKLIGRVRYRCKDIFIGKSLTKIFLSKSVDLETERRDKLDNPKELTELTKKIYVEKYSLLENEWLVVWKDVSFRLNAFFKKHPKPQKSNYFRSGIASLMFGKFKKELFYHDVSEHHRRLTWLCEKLSYEFNDLNLYFDAICPGVCGELISFNLDFDFSPSSLELIEERYPFPIYRKLNLIGGSCPECGSFQILFDDEYTSVARNYQAEIIYTIGKGIIQDYIAYLMSNELFKYSD